MKHEILSWAFGFFSPLVVVVLLAVVFAGFGCWFSLPEQFKWLDMEKAWAGGFLLVGLCILTGVACFRFM